MKKKLILFRYVLEIAKNRICSFPYLLSLVLLSVNGCINNKDKSNFRREIHICGDVYLKMYTVFSSGAFGGDLISEYLTDRKNFQKYIGTYDSGQEGISYECTGGTIFVKHYKDDYNIGKWRSVVIKLDTLMLSQLIKEKIND